jgi:hypothetical protein
VPQYTGTGSCSDGRFTAVEGPTDEKREATAALFESWDAHLAADIASMGVGMAGVASDSAMAVATPAFFDFVPGRRSKPLPHWILVRTDSWGIHLHRSDRKGAEGSLIAEAASGTFRATLHHYLSER